MENCLIAFAVIALSRVVGIVAQNSFGAVFGQAKRLIRVGGFILRKPLVDAVNRFHVPAVIVVVAHDIGNLIEL